MLSKKKQREEEIHKLNCEITALKSELVAKNQNIFAPYIKQYLQEHLKIQTTTWKVYDSSDIKITIKLFLDNEIITESTDYF